MTNDTNALVKRQCCGIDLAIMQGGNWGDLRCEHCHVAYCQDCGSQINMSTMNCMAYEESNSDAA